MNPIDLKILAQIRLRDLEHCLLNYMLCSEECWNDGMKVYSRKWQKKFEEYQPEWLYWKDMQKLLKKELEL